MMLRSYKKYELITLYDATPKFSLKGMNLEEMYHALGSDSSRGCSRNKIYDTLRERIFDLINVKSKEAPHITYSELLQFGRKDCKSEFFITKIKYFAKIGICICICHFFFVPLHANLCIIINI